MSGLRKEFVPGEQRLRFLGEGEINEEKSSLGGVVLPCYHLWTWVYRESSSFSSLRNLRFVAPYPDWAVVVPWLLKTYWSFPVVYLRPPNYSTALNSSQDNEHHPFSFDWSARLSPSQWWLRWGSDITKHYLWHYSCVGEVAREAKMWLWHFKVPFLTHLGGRGNDKEAKRFG